MKHYTPPPISPDVILVLRHRIASGATQAEIVQEMRRLGLHQAESIKLIRLLYGESLGDAKKIIHFSPTWADCRDRNEALHEAAILAAAELDSDQSNGVIRVQRNEVLR